LLIWRPIMAGKVTLDGVLAGGVTLVHLCKLNSLLDFQAACERVASARHK
jgi:hypothetical protein